MCVPSQPECSPILVQRSMCVPSQPECSPILVQRSMCVPSHLKVYLKHHHSCQVVWLCHLLIVKFLLCVVPSTWNICNAHCWWSGHARLKAICGCGTAARSDRRETQLSTGQGSKQAEQHALPGRWLSVQSGIKAACCIIWCVIIYKKR